MLRYITPIVIFVGTLIFCGMFISREVNPPIDGLKLSQNIKLMFLQVEWALLDEMLTKLALIFGIAMGFALVKNRWVKSILFVLSVWSIYGIQLKYMRSQFNIVMRDVQVLLFHSQEATAQNYPYAPIDVAINFCFSMLLVAALCINIFQLRRSF